MAYTLSLDIRSIADKTGNVNGQERANDQDHRAGGPTRVIVEKPKTSNDANVVE